MNPDWFAGRLRELREQAGLSREQLAERAGMKVGGIRDLEQGRRQPALSTFIALCQALAVSADGMLAKPTTHHEPKPGRPRKENVETAPSGKKAKSPARKGKASR